MRRDVLIDQLLERLAIVLPVAASTSGDTAEPLLPIHWTRNTQSITDLSQCFRGCVSGDLITVILAQFHRISPFLTPLTHITQFYIVGNKEREEGKIAVWRATIMCAPAHTRARAA